MALTDLPDRLARLRRLEAEAAKNPGEERSRDRGRAPCRDGLGPGGAARLAPAAPGHCPSLAGIHGHDNRPLSIILLILAVLAYFNYQRFMSERNAAEPVVTPGAAAEP